MAKYNLPLAKKEKIVKQKGSNAYSLTIPKSILVGLGWLDGGKRKKYREGEKRDREEINVKLIPNLLNKKQLMIVLTKEIEKGFYLKRISEFNRDKKEPKKYRERRKEFLREVKKKQLVEKHPINPKSTNHSIKKTENT